MHCKPLLIVISPEQLGKGEITVVLIAVKVKDFHD